MARAPMPAPQPLESPAVRRSALLAKLLEEQRQPVEIKGGYGELAARLLAQGITQWGANKADKAVRTEREQRMNSQRDALLANLPPVPGAAPAMPAPAGPALAAALSPPPVTNTQEPVQAQIAPASSVAGFSMPPAAPAGMPAAPMPMADVPPVQSPPAPMPQAAPMAPAPQPAPAAANPLDATPEEIALIREAANSGDPGRLAWAQQIWEEIRIRKADPAAGRQEVQMVNGVPHYIDPAGVAPPRPVFPNGLPTETMAQNAVVGPDNPYGVAAGTGISLDAYNRPQIIGRPPEGYTRGASGNLLPEVGSTQDLPNNPRARFEAITAEQGRIKPILDQATSLNRNIQAVRAGIRAQNGSGDNAIINGLQRLTDDGVVREGDVALQLRMQGIEGGISGLLGYLRSDGTFSPEIRQQLSTLAEDIYSNQNPLYREQIMGRRDFLERSLGAGAFDDVVPPSVRQAYGWESAPSTPAPNAPALRRPAPSAPSAPRRSNGQTRRYNPNTGQLE